MMALRTARALPAALLRPRSSLPPRAAFHSSAAPRALLETEVTGQVGTDRRDPRLQQYGSAEASAASAESLSVKPGDDDRARFQLHWSVDMW